MSAESIDTVRSELAEAHQDTLPAEEGEELGESGDIEHHGADIAGTDPQADPDADPDAGPGADPDADPDVDPDADPDARSSTIEHSSLHFDAETSRMEAPSQREDVGTRAEEKVNILMVDDYPENLMALQAILDDLGQNLVKATSGREALRKLLDTEFAVILLDVQMPGMDGFETASMIRERAKLQHTPIIFLTAMDKSETNVFRGYSVGAVDYIFKPFEPEVLKAKVSVFIELFRKTAEVKRQAELLRQANRELGKTNKLMSGLYSELEHKNEELHTERDFIATVLQTAGSFVLVMDGQGRIQRFNRACEQITGYTFEEVRGRYVWEILAPPEQVEELKERVRTGNYPVEPEGVWRSKSGQLRHVAWTNSAIYDAEGRVGYYISTGIDITDRIRAEAEVRRLNEDLERRVIERTAQLQRANEELEGEIAERRRAEDALRQSEARFRRLFESNMIGIFFSDLDGTIIDANDAFLTIVGFDRADLVAESLRMNQLTPAEYVESDASRIAELRDRRVCSAYEKELVRKDGVRVPILIGMALLEGSEHITVAFVIDLTESKRAQLELQEAKDVAEAANRAKDQFLAVLSHELRTPLNPVLAAAAALSEETGLSEEVRPFVDIIRRNCELEARLIDDLLDLTRITNGKLQLNLENVDVHTLVKNALEICHADIQAKSLDVVLELGAERILVCGDSARLHQVFWNLIKNAVKFTPDGGWIKLRTANDKSRIRIDVIDSGIGIEPSVLPRIFDAFEQGEQTITRRFGGLGLGLAISKMLVDLHGGGLCAASEGKDRGATFTVELETVGAGRQISSDETDNGLAAQSHGTARILLVDDHADTSRVMKIMLEQKGYQVVTADSVRTALARAVDSEFDLLISDIGLPDGSGLELIQEINKIRPIPGIALSGFGMEEDIQKSRDAGFQTHLTKPINFKQLHEAIQRSVS